MAETGKEVVLEEKRGRSPTPKVLSQSPAKVVSAKKVV